MLLFFDHGSPNDSKTHAAPSLAVEDIPNAGPTQILRGFEQDVALAVVCLRRKSVGQGCRHPLSP